jgi:hypothetical protein
MNGSLKDQTVLIIGPAHRDTRGHCPGPVFAMTNTFLTGQTLHIDGGEPLT